MKIHEQKFIIKMNKLHYLNLKFEYCILKYKFKIMMTVHRYTFVQAFEYANIVGLWPSIISLE
jgi:desulfoferrodoxin (superoxide reductase-like protein)